MSDIQQRGYKLSKGVQKKSSDLTAKQRAFANEYLIDLNATQAAIRAGYSAKTASSQGERLLRNVEVKAYIMVLMREREERTEITADMVLKRWWQLANADPNELIQYRRDACRCCHGKGHKYQWIDEAEFKRAVADAKSKKDDAGNQLVGTPTNEGGYGFDPKADPHPGCPKCHGEGVGSVYAADTRRLTGPAKLLYDGVKMTQFGLEIKMQDRGKALENVARHLGMFNDKLTLKGDAENPLTLLLKRVSGTSLPVVKELPEE